MKLNRKLFFRIHSWIGIKLSILFFIVCFSGTLATLSSEMDWLFLPESRAVPQETFAPRNEIVKNLQDVYPEGKIEFWTAMEVPYLCDLIYMNEGGNRTYVFANPYTGEIQGEAPITFRRFFRDLHYYLFIPLGFGHFTVLFFGFLLFISLVTGLLFYKQWYKKLFELKRGKGKVVLFRSIHRLVGVWSVPFMILFSITGIWYFLERTNTADIATEANTRTPKLEVPMTDTSLLNNITYTFDYDKASKAAEKTIPGLRVKTFSPPSKLDRPFYLTGQSEAPLVRFRANRIYIHPQNYEVIKVQKAEETSNITWLNDIADPLHFGYWGGLLTKIIWFFAGLGISGLILTGIWISLKRKVKNRLKQENQRLGKWKYPNWIIFGLVMLGMYLTLILRYKASLLTISIVTIGWLVLAYVTWYIFVYKMREIVKKELVKK